MSKSVPVCEHPVSMAAFPRSIPLHGREREFGEQSPGNTSSSTLDKSSDSATVLLTDHSYLSAQRKSVREGQSNPLFSL